MILCGCCTALTAPRSAPAQTAQRSRPALNGRNEAADGKQTAQQSAAKRHQRGPEVFYCDTPETSCRTTRETFALADLRDLYVFVVWPGVAGEHVQTVQFLLPDGSVYFSAQTHFVIGGASTGAGTGRSTHQEVSAPRPAAHLMADANKVHTEGIPSLLSDSRGDPSVVTVLPVAGTYITQRNISGTWQVRVLLDDQVAVESSFTLTAVATQDSAEGERP